MVEGDLRAEAISFAKTVAGKPLRRVATCRRRPPIPACSMRCASRSPAARATRRRPTTASRRWRRRRRCPSTKAWRERRLFAELENSDEAKALRYAFFAEREVARIPVLPKDLPLPEIRTAAVVGAGTMGGGIAMGFADFGIPVKLLDASAEALDKGMQRIRDNYAVSVKRGSLTQAQMDQRCR